MERHAQNTWAFVHHVLFTIPTMPRERHAQNTWAFVDHVLFIILPCQERDMLRIYGRSFIMYYSLSLPCQERDMLIIHGRSLIMYYSISLPCQERDMHIIHGRSLIMYYSLSYHALDILYLFNKACLALHSVPSPSRMLQAESMPNYPDSPFATFRGQH